VRRAAPQRGEIKNRNTAVLLCDHDKQHQQLNEHKGIIGIHGGDHAVYHALAEVQTGRLHDPFIPDQFLVP